jgi:hypothetical protein
MLVAKTIKGVQQMSTNCDPKIFCFGKLLLNTRVTKRSSLSSKKTLHISRFALCITQNTSKPHSENPNVGFESYSQLNILKVVRIFINPKTGRVF